MSIVATILRHRCVNLAQLGRLVLLLQRNSNTIMAGSVDKSY